MDGANDCLMIPIDNTMIVDENALPVSSNPLGDSTANQWLKSSSMVATKHCMALVSTVLSFDIVELWSCCTTDVGEMDLQSLRCTYVYASKSLNEDYPELITGSYPAQKKTHKVSPALVELAFNSKDRYHWRVVPELTTSGKTKLHPNLWFPGKTEMAYMMKGSGTEEMDHLCVFIVAFSVDEVRLKPARLKFLDGIGTAIYVAAAYLDEDECKEEGVDVELDIKEFNPQRPMHVHSDHDRSDRESAEHEVFSREGMTRSGSLGMGVWCDSPSRSRAGSNAPAVVFYDLQLPAVNTTHNYLEYGNASSSSDASSSVNQNLQSQGEKSEGERGVSFHSQSSKGMSLAIPEFSNRHRGESSQNFPVDVCTESIHLPPTWAPQYEFSYPVINIPVAHQNVPDNLVLDRDFRNVTHMCNGSNSNIYRAILRTDATDQWVIIKMIMMEAQHDPVAVHEFGEFSLINV